jgi:hypothetical protein
MDNYCSELYSPKASGNLVIERHKPIQIMEGETANQFSEVFFRYSMAKIKNKRYLPADFLSILDRYNYFDKLDDFIHRRPIPKMSLEERLGSEHMEHLLDGIWQSAVEQTILSRMSAKYKGFHQIPTRLMPIEYELEEHRMRRNLISEFSKVLWKDNANWKKVIDGFNDLKLSFYNLFEKLDIPNDLRQDWKNRIRSIELVLPGSLPEISDEECSTTTINAYYYKYLNVLTVCAGDFNSEDILLTLAHEMSHALGLDRGLYTYLQNSTLAQEQKDLRNKLCTPKAEWSCQDWEKFKNDLPQNLSKIEGYKAPLPEFGQCLKKVRETRPLTSADLDRLSMKISKNRISAFASTDLILRLIKDTLPMKNGKMQANPNYMNPCSYYLWSKKEEPVEDDIYSLIYFAAEYKCSSSEESTRLKSAIDTSEKLTASVLKTVLKVEGEFSDRPELTSEGFSSPPFERFADVVGTYAVSEYLTRFSGEWERRTKFLASSSWLCQEPSLESKYPVESSVVMQFSLDPHSQGEDRKMEIFSKPILSMSVLSHLKSKLSESCCPFAFAAWIFCRNQRK